MKKVGIILLSLCLVAESASALEACEKQWEQLYSKYSNAPVEAHFNELYEMWKEKADSCGGSDYFELQKGWLETQIVEFDLAESTFENGRKKAQSYLPEIELGLANLPFQRATRTSANVDERLLLEGEKKLLAFIDKYPKRADGYGMLAGVFLVKGEFNLVVEYSEKAIQYAAEPFAMRNGAIAYYQLENDKKTIEFGTKAIEMAPVLKSDTDLMLSLAHAYANLNNFELSLKVLTMLVDSNKEAKATDKFQSSLAEIRKQYVESDN